MKKLNLLKRVCCLAVISISLVLITSGCGSKTSVAEKSAVEYAKEKAENANIEVIYSDLDTVPYYLMKDLLGKGLLYYECDKDYYKSPDRMERMRKEIKDLYGGIKSKPSEAYVTCMNITEETPLGQHNEKKIVIADKDNPENIIGSYSIDLSFFKGYKAIKELCEDYTFKTNDFGKIDSGDLSDVEKFIVEKFTIG